MKTLRCLIGLHKWEYNKIVRGITVDKLSGKRKCKICGKEQYWACDSLIGLQDGWIDK